ncbi:nitroreductase [Bacillus sp. 03113]|uniref:nitroreductase family protein n=1 Tax=Bacillus sp. 03113 TaxID=2578211 RepID=UPI0011414581|nr:nitroreductase [Bacillus sp. 03113]
MDLFDAIKTRRSIGVVQQNPVPKELIEKILEAGTWAPNHHRTEPWRFFVLTGDGRKKLGETLASIKIKSLHDPDSEESQKVIDKEKNKPLRAPVVIVAAVQPTKNNKVFVQEEYAAVHAACQNILLAAHALGLGAVWRTGDVCYAPEVSSLFNLPEDGEVVGFIYLGYPNMKQLKGKRKPLDEVTTWIDTI